MRIKKVLEAALMTLDNGQSWTKDTAARDGAGEPIQPTNRVAVSWCAMGAVEKGGVIVHASIETIRETHNVLYRTLIRNPEVFWSSVPAFNDHKDTTYEDIALLFKKAIHSLDD